MKGAHQARGLAVAGVSVVLPYAGHGLAGLAIAAVTIIAVTAITVLGPELFWLLALRQPSRDLRRLMRKLTPQDAARLSRQLSDAYGKVTAARVGSPRGRAKRGEDSERVVGEGDEHH
jgi:hypothetical protein